MTVWSLASSAAAVSSSPNTQLQETRLAMTSTAGAMSSTYGWLYVLPLTPEIGQIAGALGPQLSQMVTSAQAVASPTALLNPY